MTTEEIKCRLMEILCEAENDQRQPVDTLNDMMESIKNLAQEMGRGGKLMTNFKKWKKWLVNFMELVLRLIGGLVGLAIIVAAPVAVIYGFVAGLIYVVLKVLQTTGVL